MARNGSGAMSLALTFSANTPAKAEDVDTVLSDIAAEITNSVAADGQTSMTNQLKGYNGGATAPTYSFGNDLDTGFGRAGANNPIIAANGATVASFTTTGVSITGTLGTSGALTVTSGGVTITAGGLTVTDDGATITAGGLTVEADGAAITGNSSVTGTTTLTSANASALSVGANGATNPALQVDASASSIATGLKVTGAAAASGVALGVISSGSNENLAIDAKGSGTITLNGTGTGNITTPRGLFSTGTAGVGYAAGAGGTVTQSTNKSTGVTLNKTSGQITMNNASLSAGAEVSFTLTNSCIAATDVVVVCVTSGATAATYCPFVDAVADGSCQISISNVGTTKAEAIVLNFVVIKGANS